MGYSGDRPQNATLVDVEIARKPKNQIGFAVDSKRWIVERFLACISRNRRLWKIRKLPSSPQRPSFAQHPS
jgi:hypothetical protein